MGVIKPEVYESHVNKFPNEKSLLQPFLNGFDVTWGRRRSAYNTELSVYFLKPELYMTQMFGFEHELILFVSNYPTIEARTLQAVDTLIGGDPARGRVEQSIFFLISPASDGRQWVADYTSRNPQARIPIVFNSTEILNKGSDSWFTRNVLRSQLFARDLFDYQLPLDSDLFFFGRDQIVADHLDAIRRSQNRGLFGLRKTGKTSILYKVRRLMEAERLGAFLYYDCKLPSIRMLRWHELLARIVRDICDKYRLASPEASILQDERRISDVLMDTLRRVPANNLTALVFDEIEYISPLAVDDQHWIKDFVPFWQTLWAAQSQIRRLSNTVVGVNPTIVEVDTFDDVQNPMFGIIQPRYLQGLAPQELRGMVRFFGKRMGLSFEVDACDYLQSRYGGHALLTRMACSAIHQTLDRHGVERPRTLSVKDLKEGEDARDSELTFYCRHVVSELRKFYPDEYELLEMLASGGVLDVMDLSTEPEFTRHLKEYGLIEVDVVHRPHFKIPVVGQYIGNELARRENRRLVKRVIPIYERQAWVSRRVNIIAREFRELVRILTEKNIEPPIAGDSFPEKERFLATIPVVTQDDFVVFINVCNRCFVEATERHGRSKGDNKFYWNYVKVNFPDMWEAFQRIKVYRHNDVHLDLTFTTEVEFRRFVETDLEGRRPAQVEEVEFVLQQSVLDSLLLGVQCELNRYC